MFFFYRVLFFLSFPEPWHLARTEVFVVIRTCIISATAVLPRFCDILVSHDIKKYWQLIKVRNTRSVCRTHKATRALCNL